MHKNLRILYITTQNLEQARNLGKEIVAQNMAACANIIPKMYSIYHWDGDLCEDEETILIVKTHTSRVNEITNYIKKAHTYDCPCVISIPLAEDEGNEDYLNWLLNESKL